MSSGWMNNDAEGAVGPPEPQGSGTEMRYSVRPRVRFDAARYVKELTQAGQHFVRNGLVANPANAAAAETRRERSSR